MWFWIGILSVVVILIVVLYLVRPIYQPECLSDLRDFHVVITGGSSGIGKEIARQLLTEHKARVTILARNQTRLDECRKELSGENGDRLFCCSVDVGGNYDEVENSIKKACEFHGNRPVSILINSAAIYYAKVFEEMSPKQFEEMIRINYLGSVYSAKACLPSMKKIGFGRIVFISSQAGQIGVFGYTSYCGTKFALKGLAEALQMELARSNIFVTVAFPPDTETPGFAEENKTKPIETRLINETSGVSTADEVAKRIVDSLRKGQFSCWFGLNGFLLSSLTSGAQPFTTFVELLLHCLTIGLARLIIAGLLNTFYKITKNKKLKRE